MKRLKSRAAAMLLISMMCFSILLSANIFKILPAHAIVVADTIPVGTGPYGVAYDSGKGEIFVTNWGVNYGDDGSVSVILDSTNTVIATVPVGKNPQGVAYDSFQNEIFAANYGSSTVSVISDSTNAVVATVNVGGNPDAVAYDAGNKELYVPNWVSGSVSVISDYDNTVVATVGVGVNPSAVAYDSGRGEIFVTNQVSGTVSVISDSNNTVVATVNVGTAPDGVAYDSVKGEIFVANWGSGSVSVIDDSSNNVVGTVTVGAFPRTVAYDSGRGEIYTTNWNDGTVSVISDSTDTVIATVPVGSTPAGAAYDSVWSEVFVANSGSNTVSVIVDSPPVITLNPGTGRVGDFVTLSGYRFNSYETITIKYDSIVITTTVASGGNGGFSMSFTVPASTAGPHTVSSTDSSGQSATAAFTVTPAIVLSPSSGIVGDSVTVTGSGFFADAGISIFYDSAQQGSSFISDGYGGFSWTFTVPPSTAGPHTVYAFEESVGQAATASFTVGATLIVSSTVEGGSPSEPWNYLVTDASNGSVVGNFTIPAEGGTYSLYGLGSGLYWVNETAKYYYGIPNIEYNGIVVDDYGTLVDCTGFIDANVTFTHIAPALGEASLGGIVPVDWFYSIPAQQPIPIQAAAPVDINKDGRTDLVLGKPMAILVNLTNLPPFDGQVSVSFGGGPFYTQRVTAANVTSKSVIAFYPIVPNSAGNYTVTGNYTLGANVGTLPYHTDVTVKATKDLTLYFECMNATAYGYVNEATFKNDVGNITAFINATYPVKNVTVYANYAGSSVTGASGAGGKTAMQTDCTAVMNKAKAALTLNGKNPANFNATTIGIAIAPNNTGMTDYFSDKGYSGAVGVSQGPGTKGVIVLDGYYAAGAHEVAHTFKLYYGIPEQYQGLPYNVTGGMPSNGVWAQQGEWRTGISFMGLIPQGVLNKTWEDNVYTYYWLFRNLTVSANDPEILQTNGIIHKDDTVEFTSNWYHMDQGTPDTVDPGDYSLVFLDAESHTLKVTSFDAKFSMNIDPGVTIGQNLIDTTKFGTQDADIATFAFLTEYPAGTASIQIVDNTDPAHPKVMSTVDAKTIINIEPELKMQTYFTDSNFNPINSFDVLFTPSIGTTLKLTATNPATYYHTLDFKNNGPALSSLIITVQIPTDFKLEGTQPVQIDFNPVSYTFANGVLNVTVPNVASGQTFTLRIHLNYNLKGTKPYQPDSPTNYFKQYTFQTVANDVFSKTATITAVGKKATAISGFVIDTAGRPKGGLQVKVYKGLTLKWNTIVDGDGFYFVNVDAGGPYTILLLNSNNVPVWLKTGVNVANGALVSVDFQVLPIDCAIQGFIKDTQNIPVAGVRVQLLNQAGNVITTTTTNLGGYYVFRFYLPGTYTVKITVPPGYSATSVSKTIRVRLTETATVNFDLTKN